LPGHRFDYSVFRDAKAPVIPIEVWGKGRWHNMWVYVDSGASFTVFHTYEAKRLGVRLSRCEKFFLTVAGDRQIPVYTARLGMKIGASRFRAQVGFCSVLGGAFNLLGRQDVFNLFQVTFDDKNETVTFRRPSRSRK
jgi:hypothetical protein